MPIGTVTTRSFLSSVTDTNQSWANKPYSNKLSFVHPKIKQDDHLKEISKKFGVHSERYIGAPLQK